MEIWTSRDTSAHPSEELFAIHQHYFRQRLFTSRFSSEDLLRVASSRHLILHPKVFGDVMRDLTCF